MARVGRLRLRQRALRVHGHEGVERALAPRRCESSIRARQLDARQTCLLAQRYAAICGERGLARCRSRRRPPCSHRCGAFGRTGWPRRSFDDLGHEIESVLDRGRHALEQRVLIASVTRPRAAAHHVLRVRHGHDAGRVDGLSSLIIAKIASSLACTSRAAVASISMRARWAMRWTSCEGRRRHGSGSPWAIEALGAEDLAKSVQKESCDRVSYSTFFDAAPGLSDPPETVSLPLFAGSASCLISSKVIFPAISRSTSAPPTR